MRALLITAAVVATCGATLSVSGLAAAEGSRAPSAHAAARLPAWATVQSCHRSATAQGRYATFYARMRWKRRTRRMSMRFTLYEALGDGRFEPVAVPGLGRWRTSRAGVVWFGYRQTVRGLREEAAYRVVVRFRWHRRGGRVIGWTTRRSGVCSFVSAARP